MLEIRKEKYICSVCDRPRARFMCGRCHAVDYCSKDCQVKDLKRHKVVCAPAVMEAVDRRTRGIFATKDLKMGDLIFKVEADMCLKPGADLLLPRRDDIEIHKQRHMQADLQFTHMKGGGGTYLNSWNFTVLTHNKHCLFPLLCQFRHRCSSNATTNIVTDNHYIREVRAIKDIKRGEEITLNFLFTFPVSIGESDEKKIYKYLPREVRNHILSVWDAACDCHLCTLGEDEQKINEMREIKQKINSALDETSCASCDTGWAVQCAKYQKDFVDKVRASYLAPFLLPLECPLLVYYCHLGGDKKGAAEGMKLWRDAIGGRNVEIFKKYYNTMPEVLRRMNETESKGCCKTRIAQEFLDKIQSNIF